MKSGLRYNFPDHFTMADNSFLNVFISADVEDTRKGTMMLCCATKRDSPMVNLYILFFFSLLLQTINFEDRSIDYHYHFQSTVDTRTSKPVVWWGITRLHKIHVYN